MKKKLDAEYVNFIVEIKQRIINSRYQAARFANREQLLLYLYVGKRISEKIEAEKWGAKVLQKIANGLQAELPGLRGFSERSLKNMRLFAEEYTDILFLPETAMEQKEIAGKTHNKNKIVKTKTTKKDGKNLIGQSTTAQLKNLIGQSATAQLKITDKKLVLSEEQLTGFFSISFTHHVVLLTKCKDKNERVFYMQMAASDMWSVSTLEHQLASKLYKYRGKLPNNFKSVLPEAMSAAALDAFKDEYLFDFMSLDDSADERVFEEKAVVNIRKFIMTLGKGFSFMGNQYKLDIDGTEYFIDLLFYNRILQCLVVFELKRGKFKPEYAGKLNFYLNVLDDKVKLLHEKPSIGIILCKEKNNTEVEYSFRSISKAMGVATYKLSTEVPKEMRGILPDAEKLKRLI